MKAKRLHLLAIEDDENDAFFLERAFQEAGAPGRVIVLSSGRQAIEYFKGEGEFADREKFPFPTLIITDLKMNGGDGFDVLQHLKTHPLSRVIPVVVMSGSNDEDDIKRVYAGGASCYLLKPADVRQLTALMKLLLDFWQTCEVPRVDVNGKQLPTDSEGKLGERFGPI